METKRTRAERQAVVMTPDVLRYFSLEQGAWHETREEVEAGLAWGNEKAHLLRWVRKQMARKLTARERRCVELYYFEGLTYREAGQITQTNASSVYRAVKRGLRKLRTEAANGPQLRRPGRRGTGPAL